MMMAIAAFLFAVFFTNVAMGAFGSGVFLGDVPEMLLLATSTVFFVAAILKSEASAKDLKK